MPGVWRVQEGLDSWFVRHAGGLKDAIRIVFGVIWGIDGSLKFQPGFVSAFVPSLQTVEQGQPSWLDPWFNFWVRTVGSQATVVVYSVGTLELLLSVSLVLGLARKVAYGGGLLLSLFIWAIPEGFGGPYGPGSTDIGTGIVYAVVFLTLMVLDASFGPSPLALDTWIERKIPSWRRIADIRTS
jgi:uncharacterized membrane protein YphA (DoxX/SURF4 family)